MGKRDYEATFRTVWLTAISLSFTAGNALGSCLGGGFATASRLCAACLIPLLLILSEEHAGSVFRLCLSVLIFLDLGMLRFCSDKLTLWYCPPPGSPVRLAREWGAKLLEDFSRMIESAGFDSGCEALLRALLTGQRDHLPEEIRLSFRKAGASHILALSGMHLGIIYGVIKLLLKPLGGSAAARRSGAVLRMAFCGIYTLAVGAGPSITRAFLFISLYEICGIFPGKKAVPSRIYLTSLMIQLSLSPSVILDAGFKLSYLAMAGIIFIFPGLEKWYPGSADTGRTGNPLRKIWSACALSISCQLLTAPLSYALFGSFPKYFLLCNLLAMPLSEALIICALATILLSVAGFSPLLMTQLCNHLGHALLSCMATIGSM